MIFLIKRLGSELSLFYFMFLWGSDQSASKWIIYCFYYHKTPCHHIKCKNSLNIYSVGKIECTCFIYCLLVYLPTYLLPTFYLSFGEIHYNAWTGLAWSLGLRLHFWLSLSINCHFTYSHHTPSCAYIFTGVQF